MRWQALWVLWMLAALIATEASAEDSPVDDLTDLLHFANIDPSVVQEHTDYIRSIFLQRKPTVYKADYSKEQKKIDMALKTITGETWSILESGHKADEQALKVGRAKGNRIIKDVQLRAKRKMPSYKAKACVARRARDGAAKAKREARDKLVAIGDGAICKTSISSVTYGDLDIDKASPSMGHTLRQTWDKTRAKYIQAKQRYKDASAVYKRASLAYSGAISAFRIALGLLASNTHADCKAAHKQYAALTREIEANVKTRKQVFISTRCISCWAKHLQNKPAARACWIREKHAPTTKWDLHPGKLQPCLGKAMNENRLGPKSWLPSSKCHTSSSRL